MYAVIYGGGGGLCPSCKIQRGGLCPSCKIQRGGLCPSCKIHGGGGILSTYTKMSRGGFVRGDYVRIPYKIGEKQLSVFGSRGGKIAP